MRARFTTIISLPPDYSETIETFQRTHTGWSARPTKITPHVTVKVGGALDDRPAIMSALADIARSTAPFDIRLTSPVMVGHALYLDVESPGLWKLHRAVVAAVAALTRTEPPEQEMDGYTPHVTLLYHTAAMAERGAEMVAVAAAELSPFPTFTATAMAMLRLDREDARFVPVRDFPLG